MINRDISRLIMTNHHPIGRGMYYHNTFKDGLTEDSLLEDQFSFEST